MPKTLTSIGLCAALITPLLVASPLAASAATRELKGPGFTGIVPEVRSFVPDGDQAFFLDASSRIVIASADEQALSDEASLLSGELATMDSASDLGITGPLPIVVGDQPHPGDIALSVGNVDEATSSEAYTVKVANTVSITGPTDTGVFNGTRTLLQALQRAGGLEHGTVRDWPTLKIRQLHLDAARKYYSMDFWREEIRQMAFMKMNTLEYHFSENEGFRLESSSHPEIVSEQHITKAQLAEIIALAAKYHIEVVPSLDVPGHMRTALDAHPELRASNTDEGRKIIDYSKPEGRKLVTDLIDEYAPLFGSTQWHLGGDEVFLLDSAQTNEQRFPTLAAYATENLGPGAKVLDGYTHYLNTVAEYLNAKGKTHVRAWNDAIYTPGTTAVLNKNIDVTYWTRWHKSFPTLQTVLDHGHQVLNYNDAYFYYVLARPGGAYSNRPKPENVYNQWRPGVFPKTSTAAQTIADDDPALKGASFAIWSDAPEVETEQQVLTNSRPLMRAMASRSWNPESKATYEQWAANSAALDPVVPSDNVPGPVHPTPQATITTSTAGPRPVNVVTNVWGTITNVEPGATVRTQALVNGQWSTSQVGTVGANGYYALPLTYGSSTAGTATYRVIVDQDGKQVASEPFAVTRLASVSSAAASTKKVGQPAYVWGTISGTRAGLPVSTQAWVNGAWSTSQRGVTTANGGYVLALTYGNSTPGSYRFRVVATVDGKQVEGQPFTLVRTR